VRGLPTLVLNTICRYGLTPVISNLINGIGSRMIEWNVLLQLAAGMSTLRVRDISSERVCFSALGGRLCGFLSKSFVQASNPLPGQIEAARALGMTYWQAMYHVVLRQAIRTSASAIGK